MGRRKIEIKAIKDDRNRSVTFLKRKGGLFKKAHELSVLCSVDVAVIIFGHNKKLYEFSSGDINETIGRYQYYGGAHEHKGPEDFMGKKDMDDDDEDMDDMGSPPPNSHSPPDHPMMPPHLQNQPPYQHIRNATPSASPPMPNGMPFHPRNPSPQPHPQQQGISRPPSRTHIRRASSNLMPPQHPQYSQPSQPQPNYAYIPPVYNHQAAQGMPEAPKPGLPPHFQYPHPPPNNAQLQQAYLQEQRRQSMPPAFPQQHQQEQRPPAPMQPTPQSQQNTFQSPPLPQPKPLSSAGKSSIFTPIDDSRSLLAQHWGSTSTAEVARMEPAIKPEFGPRSQSIDVAQMSRHQMNGVSSMPPQPQHLPQASRNPSISSLPSIPPPSRTNSIQIGGEKRPRLKVQIPSEHSDAGSATAGSSPKDTNTSSTPQRSTEASHSSIMVLPPPSPSASALLSAGATGPINPFARPPPPINHNSFGNRNDMETPISALPSRFVADGLLPSPSSFYPEWGFGRDTNMLPSPLTFQTPVVANGPSFRDEDVDKKRKPSEGSDGGANKRMKN
ncbi:hypothetical protein W97_01089 [Coniosporium apollinis CBS 100218]|uniref:MADS-box domain-containing protein n=1 Tax=Coniosporium apollinis (strain CBS 100218) TaxID=1168221 RepID=R7YJN7_CONA1|nr:uncharacterized protein W97_01089 [Coniosporium apollinis CBS 100218]EON61871.1 hypothetical protein W97_01089 [Coniosporium apollinis CBS 100218]